MNNGTALLAAQPLDQAPEKVFRPEDHIMTIKSSQGNKAYLPVQWRLVWFRGQCPNGSIETEMIHLDLDRETEEETREWNDAQKRYETVIKTGKGIAIFRAVVKDGNGGIATGTKTEKAAAFGDFIEKAETGAIGRALAGLGYGTQFAGDEIEDRQEKQQKKQQRPGYATASQISSARNLAKLLGKESTVNEDTSETDAKTLLAQLAKEVREKQASK
jgi:hypothetical protein